MWGASSPIYRVPAASAPVGHLRQPELVAGRRSSVAPGIAGMALAALAYLVDKGLYSP